jgi:hypothetical protein
LGPLTHEQWKAHCAALYQALMERGGYKAEANRYAADKMHDNFGPCPPEGRSAPSATAQGVGDGD